MTQEEYDRLSAFTLNVNLTVVDLDILRSQLGDRFEILSQETTQDMLCSRNYPLLVLRKV